MCNRKVTDNIKHSFIDFMKTKYPQFNQLDSLDIDKPEAHRNITLVIIRFSPKQVVMYTYSRYR